MQMFTGSYKKFIAGIGGALIVVCFSYPSFANDSTTLVTGSASSTVTSNIPDSENNAANNVAPITNAPVNTPKPIPAPTKTNSASQLANLIGGLALIVILIYGLSWFVKRFSQGGFLHNPAMKIVSSMPLGTRERLMLVDVGGKQLLLGVTATQINTLHVFEEPVVQAEKAQPATSDFSQKLMAILQQKNLSAAEDPTQKKSNS